MRRRALRSHDDTHLKHDARWRGAQTPEWRAFEQREIAIVGAHVKHGRAPRSEPAHRCWSRPIGCARARHAVVRPMLSHASRLHAMRPLSDAVAGIFKNSANRQRIDLIHHIPLRSSISNVNPLFASPVIGSTVRSSKECSCKPRHCKSTLRAETATHRLDNRRQK